MKKKIFALVLSFIFVFSLLSIDTGADLGPKDSVTVTFLNKGNEKCYATLLSETEYFGPYSVWDGNEEHIYNYNLDIDIWRKFAEYKDPDNFLFMQQCWDITNTDTLRWGYYPPFVFKILLYYPETDTFVTSGILEHYAFDSYYSVDMSDIDGSSADRLLMPYRSYDYSMELLSLFARILLTVLIEIGIALLFGIKKKKELLLVIGVNTVTQIILNVLLNIVNYESGQLAFSLMYIQLEILVFVIEAVLFGIFMNRLSEKKRKTYTYILYALVSNLVSFISGMLIAQIIPGIF